MNGFQYAVAAWLPIVIFPQKMAPTFRYGFPATFGFVFAGLLLVVIIQLLHQREIRRGTASGAPVTIEVGGEEGFGEGEQEIGKGNHTGVQQVKRDAE
jgi:MFS transporter, ACS family, pantothenate transporter